MTASRRPADTQSASVMASTTAQSAPADMTIRNATTGRIGVSGAQLSVVGSSGQMSGPAGASDQSPRAPITCGAVRSRYLRSDQSDQLTTYR
jgi:hypothetical protein